MGIPLSFVVLKFNKSTARLSPLYHFQLAIEAGCNGYAAPLGFLEAGAANFAGEILPILNLNNRDILKVPEPLGTLGIDADLLIPPIFHTCCQLESSIEALGTQYSNYHVDGD